MGWGWARETISVGTCVLATTAVVHPQVVTCGARRTPLPQVAPTVSERSISDQTESRVVASYWAAQPTWRSQFAMNSSRGWVFMAAPFAGTWAGGSALAAALYAGGNEYHLAALSACWPRVTPARGPPQVRAPT